MVETVIKRNFEKSVKKLLTNKKTRAMINELRLKNGQHTKSSRGLSPAQVKALDGP